jgi:RNA polymerase sigma-70 factor (ECF subfamily)
VRAVIAGDRDAYASLVRAYQGLVVRFCLSFLSSSVEAEDAAQDVFVKAYQALPRFRGNSSFSTWVYRIASNHCKDLLRKRARQKTESWEALLEREGEKIERLFSASEQTPLPPEHAELITTILSHLPLKYRTILVLRDVEGLSYAEVASVLNCSLDAVKARLRRARQELGQKVRHFLRHESV